MARWKECVVASRSRLHFLPGHVSSAKYMDRLGNCRHCRRLLWTVDHTAPEPESESELEPKPMRGVKNLKCKHAARVPSPFSFSLSLYSLAGHSTFVVVAPWGQKKSPKEIERKDFAAHFDFNSLIRMNYLFRLSWSFGASVLGLCRGRLGVAGIIFIARHKEQRYLWGNALYTARSNRSNYRTRHAKFINKHKNCLRIYFILIQFNNLNSHKVFTL